MDLLSEILGELRVESTVLCGFAVADGRGVAYPAGGMAGFHVVIEGTLLLVPDAGPPLPLEAGDFVVVPHGAGHRVQAGRSARVAPIAQLARPGPDGEARVGSAAPVGRYVCGAFHFAAAGDHPLLSALPPVIRIGASSATDQPWLRTHLAAVACESRSGRPGAAAVIARLSEVLFVQAIHAHLAELPPGARGWLGALRDPALARAVARIHQAPERPWTVAALAGEAGLSRSHFAERFAAVLGRPPLAYLAEWRMHRGRALLRDGTLRVHEVARRVGYRSETAFSTAFRRTSGVAPGAYRRQAGSLAPSAPPAPPSWTIAAGRPRQ